MDAKEMWEKVALIHYTPEQVAAMQASKRRLVETPEVGPSLGGALRGVPEHLQHLLASEQTLSRQPSAWSGMSPIMRALLLAGTAGLGGGALGGMFRGGGMSGWDFLLPALLAGGGYAATGGRLDPILESLSGLGSAARSGAKDITNRVQGWTGAGTGAD